MGLALYFPLFKAFSLKVAFNTVLIDTDSPRLPLRLPLGFT